MTTQSPTRTFQSWRAAVDRAVQSRIGLSLDDLPDVPLRDWFEDDYTPGQAAVKVLFDAGFRK